MFTPTKLEEIIGLVNVKKRIEIAVAAAKAEDRPVRHTLLHGPPGTGKTTLGRVMATMMDANLHYTVGKGLNISKEVRKLGTNDILFIDELHTLKREEEEKLYTPMTDFMWIDNTGLYDTPIQLNPFTVMGATTLVGRISKPLVDRFPLQFAVALYTVADLAQIIEQVAQRDGIDIDQQAILMLAKAGRDTPRVALSLLTNVVEFLLYKRQYTINTEIIDAVFQLIGIRTDGLMKQDVEYMRLLLESNRPMGLNAIAATLLTDAQTVRDFIEPFLLRKSYIAITGGGRVLLQKGLRVAQNGK